MHFLKNVLSNIRYSAVYAYSVGGLILPPAFLDQLWSSLLLKVFWVLKESTRSTCLLLMLPGNTQKQSLKLFENDTANAYVKHSLLPFLNLFIYSLHRCVGTECFFSSCEAAFFTSRWYLCGSRERLSNDGKFVLSVMGSVPPGNSLNPSKLLCWAVSYWTKRGKWSWNCKTYSQLKKTMHLLLKQLRWSIYAEEK